MPWQADDFFRRVRDLVLTKSSRRLALADERFCTVKWRPEVGPQREFIHRLNKQLIHDACTGHTTGAL